VLAEFSKRLFVRLAILLAISSSIAFAHAAELEDASFQDGLAAREEWESWISSLTGDMRAGAEYWAGQRSLANPSSCRRPADGDTPPARAEGARWR
jgi:hypothetical protein